MAVDFLTLAKIHRHLYYLVFALKNAINQCVASLNSHQIFFNFEQLRPRKERDDDTRQMSMARIMLFPHSEDM